MKMINVNPPGLKKCPVCLGELNKDQNFPYLGEYKIPEDTFSLFKCPICGVKFWIPFKNPGPEWYEKCKQNLMHRDYEDRNYFLWLSENRGITKHFTKNPPHKNPNGLSLLDVGCGTGGFLLEAEKLGYKVTGVDFDIEQINVAKSFGLKNVYADDVLDFLSKHRGEFDVITGFEIIEHLDYPRKFLESIYKALKPGGVLCLSTPNNNRVGPKNEFWDFPYHHLTRWTKKSLGNIVRLENFKSIKIVEELPMPYLVSKFRVGLGAFLRKKIQKEKIKAGPTKQYKDTVAKLGSIKDRILSIILFPAALTIFIAGKRGQGLYLTARK